METIIRIIMLVDFSAVLIQTQATISCFQCLDIIQRHHIFPWQDILQRCMLRRTKEERKADLQLPPIKVLGDWGWASWVQLADVTGVIWKSFGTCWELAKLRSSNIPWKGFLCKGTCAWSLWAGFCCWRYCRDATRRIAASSGVHPKGQAFQTGAFAQCDGRCDDGVFFVAPTCWRDTMAAWEVTVLVATRRQTSTPASTCSFLASNLWWRKWLEDPWAQFVCWCLMSGQLHRTASLWQFLDIFGPRSCRKL